MRFFFVAFTYVSRLVVAQNGVISPVAQLCHACLPSVLCINKYAAVLPYHFFRDANTTQDTTFGATSVPADSSFALINQSDFLVYERERGLDLLGPNPSYEYVFNVSKAVHEAPVYAPLQNKLYLSQLSPPSGYLPQLVIDLNKQPPTLSEYLPDPSVYAPNGGTYYRGKIYLGASGGNNSLGGIEHRAGIVTLDPTTNKTTYLLNNYFGYYFNTIDDLFVHPNGDVWFTDPHYSWFNKLTDTPPQLETASYRFRPSTGAVHIVDNTLAQPNGIAISPDFQTVYISDTGAVSAPISPLLPATGASFNATGKRIVYAFDLSPDATYLSNRRPIYLAQEWGPDGLKVAANGYVVAATGKGVDVLDATGRLLVRVQTNFTVQNFAWTGPRLRTLWMVGQGGIGKVEWDLQGQDLSKY